MDVQSPEGGSPTHTLPSLSRREREKEREDRKRILLMQGNNKELDSQHLETKCCCITLKK